MELQDFPPELQEMILMELNELHRKDWQQQINVVNTEYFRFWDSYGCYTDTPYTREDPSPIEFYMVHIGDYNPEENDHSYHGRQANHRQFPVHKPDPSARNFSNIYWDHYIWNWKTTSAVCHVPDCY